MSTALLVILILVFLCFSFVILLYNKFIHSNNLVNEAWSNIDVQLKCRHDLIPNLVEIVKGYSKHEHDTLIEVINLRNQSQGVTNSDTTIQKSQIEQNISRDLKKIIALAEAYPDLKADKNFLDLQATLTTIEDDLQYARRYYNGSIRNYNILIESIPSNIVANIFNFKPRDFFEIEYATERRVPETKFSS